MKTTVRDVGLSFGLAMCLMAGCTRSEPPQYVTTKAVNELTPALQSAVHESLVHHTGTFLKPKPILESDELPPDLVRGKAVYQERCVQCHGTTGDGEGPAAQYMYPRPRDYRKGIFKFTSNPYGYHPLREDLVRTVRQGIRGTSMPGFSLLPEADQQSVVDYVIYLTRRGELELQMIGLAEAEEAVEEELVTTELIPTVLNKWTESISQEMHPLTPQPRFTAENVELGKQAFLTRGCSKCHGEDGRGQTKDNRGTDGWGFPTRAADLTSGMLHGGNRPIDIYRRIYGGINGTPMPSFANVLKEEPETIWNLVAYVLSISSRRRAGEIPPPGAMNPYVPRDAAPAAEPEPAP